MKLRNRSGSNLITRRISSEISHRIQPQFPLIFNHHNTVIQLQQLKSMSVKIKGPITRCHAPRENEEHKDTGLSIKDHYSCARD